MYRIDKRKKYKKYVLPLFIVVWIVSLGFAGWMWLQHDGNSMVTKQSELNVNRVANGTGEVVFDEPLFSITMPGEWELDKKTERPRTYYFRSTQKNADAKTLVIYVDADTENYSVNRVLPVTPQGNKLITGDISDTCLNFVGGGEGSQEAGEKIGRWQGVRFICDLGHQNRNAIGVSSDEGMNKFTLNGPKGGEHSYFMIYTDHNISPDLNLADKIISSFEAK